MQEKSLYENLPQEQIPREESYYRLLQNDTCTVHFLIGNQLGIDKTRKELYEEVCKINMRYNQ